METGIQKRGRLAMTTNLESLFTKATNKWDNDFKQFINDDKMQSDLKKMEIELEATMIESGYAEGRVKIVELIASKENELMSALQTEDDMRN